MGWIASCQEQLSVSSRREAAEEWQQERQHLNRMALEGSRGVRAEVSKVKADTLILREKGKKAIIHKCEESDVWAVQEAARATSLRNSAAEKGQPGKDSGQK